MDPQCILWRPYLASLDHPSIGMPALCFEICHDICWMFVCSFRQVLRVYTLAWESTKYFSYQFLSSNFILCGEICYTSKLLPLIVSQVSSLQRLQVSHFAHKVASVYVSHKCRKNIKQRMFPWCLCCAYNDMRKTLETPQTSDLEEEKWVNKLANLLPPKSTSKNEFWRGALPLTLSRSAGAPHTLLGSVITLPGPFEGAL